ncbi:MAG TPA: serine kinase [Firmicutes bacterium]|uniref:Serine kinase n=1 Tax=Candidatus Fermentithermobacillus carboniphilus TaxID=3085328 RepID=A0AAT9LA79_9FIRM|nr:MAG: serine kinase [Candidatus Fermentithermobacillus carboniphilus]HHW18840.1 serine kinase [Candidatus Fermentithermobacillaceae bacterium]
MFVRDMVSNLNLEVKAMTKEGSLRKVEGGYVGDVLSHVMANAQPGYAWITVQTHENIVAVASLLDVACIIVCQRELPAQTQERAKKEAVTLLWTESGAFEIAGRLYSLLYPEGR